MTVSFRAKLLASHAAVALAVGAVTLVVVERSISQRMEAQVDSRLEAQAQAVARWLDRAGRHPNRLAGRLAGVVGARVTILDAEGSAVGDSYEGDSGHGSQLRAAEFSAARSGGVGRATRFGAEGEQVRYVAVPAPRELVVRLGLPLGEIDETKSELRRQLGVGALASLFVALALAALVAGPLTRRLRVATGLAERIGAGDYDFDSLPDDGSDEVGVLSSTLAAAAIELRATEERRREFLAIVAHEIRTPVTSIRGYAQTLLGDNVDAEHREEFAQTIHRNALRISRLVEDLLELEAIQRGGELARQEVALAPVAGHVLETLRTPIDEVEAQIHSSIADSVLVRGDADAVERILLNLTENALRHGGRGVRVELAAASSGDRVTVTVSDNGPGIPGEQRERIFERFQRGGGKSERHGSGLGLAIARELANAMGGTLTLEESETGATFRLELPA